ncbi:MAG: aspartate-semialdehyde dehydrogenase [Candidatus Kariarchaeaceae archaeon]
MILGASGIIGQQFIRILAEHPFLKLDSIYASHNSVGKKVEDVWRLPRYEVPESVRTLKFENLDRLDYDIDIAFSALPADIASKVEDKLRRNGIYVFSNASTYRRDNDVPILIPEINKNHANLAKFQQEKLNSQGFIVTNANCSVTGASVYLSELNKICPIDTAVVTTYQALSGAGLHGVSGLEIANNVIPYICNEEQKIIIESQKILGNYAGNGNIEPAEIHVIANSARVPVIDGHLLAITVFPKNGLMYAEEIINKLCSVKSSIYDPSKFYIAPKTHMRITRIQDRPQPAFDSFLASPTSAEGMVVTVGRIRTDEKSISAYILVHNTIRGGAGGSVLNAEFLKSIGVI